MRRIICLLCMCAAVGLMLIPMLAEIIMPTERHTSMHPPEELPVMRGFSETSVVNIGDAQALDRLPGIGEVLSQRIVELRNALGGYRIPEDLLLVRGIGEKTLANMMEDLFESLIPLAPVEK